MPTTVTCPQCNKNYKMRDDYPGGKVRCKACNTTFTAPPSPPAPSNDPFANGNLPDLAPDPVPSAPPPLRAPTLPPRKVQAPAQPAAPSRFDIIYERWKAFLFTTILIVGGIFFIPVAYHAYSKASRLAQNGTPATAEITNYRQEVKRGKYGSKTYLDKFTIVYGDKSQHSQPNVILPIEGVFEGTTKTGRTITIDEQQVREPQIHILYLADEPTVLLAGEKGDSYSTLLSKNNQWLSVLMGLIGSPVMLFLGLAVIVKILRSRRATD